MNQFHAAGGMAFVVRELIDAGLAHEDAMTIWGPGLSAYAKDPFLVDGKLVWRDARREVARRKDPASGVESVLARTAASSCCAAISAGRSSRPRPCDPKYWDITAPARVFESQEAMAAALKAGIDGDFIAVIRGQGPRANGMPELHKLIPALSGLVSQGPARRHRHRRPHVRRVGQGAVGDPSHARSGGGWADLATARWRHHPAGCARRRARSAGRRRHACRRARSVKPELTDTTYGVGRELFTRLREGATRGRRGRVDPVKHAAASSLATASIRHILLVLAQTRRRRCRLRIAGDMCRAALIAKTDPAARIPSGCAGYCTSRSSSMRCRLLRTYSCASTLLDRQ